MPIRFGFGHISSFCPREADFFNKCFEFSKFFSEKIFPIFIKNHPLRINKKEDEELTSDIDKKIEKELEEFLFKIFLLPVLSEEKEMTWPPTIPAYWLIDPLDGTHNYLAGVMHYGVVATLIENERPTFTASFLPAEEALHKTGMYFASLGKGAWQKNGEVGNTQALKRMHVSEKNDFAKTLIYIEGPRKKMIKSEVVKKLMEKSWRYQTLAASCWAGTRIANGSSFLNGADILIANENKPWDNLPNILFIEEAGGKITDFKGEEWGLKKCANLICANATLHQKVLEIINE